MDKVEAIVGAVASALENNVGASYNVYENRGISLDYADNELPAMSVDYGEDSPLEDRGQDTLDGQVRSVVTITVTCVAADDEEPELRGRLLAMRQAVHDAIRVDRRLGLAYVLDTYYGGAQPPQTADEGETLIGALVCVWGVLYEFNVDAP